MQKQYGTSVYFPHSIQISAQTWRSHDLGALSRQIAERGIPEIIFFRQLALRLNRRSPQGSPPVHAGQLNLYASLQTVFRYLIDVVAEQQEREVLAKALRRTGIPAVDILAHSVGSCFVDLFPPLEVLDGSCTPEAWLGQETPHGPRGRGVLRELLLLKLAVDNPAVESFRCLLDDSGLSEEYRRLVDGMISALAAGPKLAGFDMTLPDIFRAPVKASPGSLSGQLDFIRDQWGELLPHDLLEMLTGVFDILLEEEREGGWGGGEPGPTRVLEFGRPPGSGTGDFSAGGASVLAGYDYPEYERFSSDADWMSNVVMIAKMVYVWLDQLTREYGRPITTLDQVPDGELDRLALAGFSALWLIGVWERSPASRRIKQLCGNPDAIASAYSLFDYEIAADLGGWAALVNLRDRARARGIRLASDMVPNHTGICSRWVFEHPEWFIQTDYPPFPSYQFNGENLSTSDNVVIQIEDGYWNRSDAAVVFRHMECSTGQTRYIYHGNDGTSYPWNDTAQLNYLIPEVREAVIQTILHVARNFPIIRFDAAMTLAKKHYQRLWFPIRGLGGGIPSRAEHGMSREAFDEAFPVEFWREVVDRVAAEAPDTLLLAEAFWLMEGYFVRTLGMHRVYNSAFMNMIKREENAKYRQTVRNVLEFNPEVLKRFVNFMNNPDEKTAVEQFGSQGKYFGACAMMVTMPGLPMFGHGQIEGFREKYGMEYRRAYWNEPVDQGLIQGHRMWIFPLLCRRDLFSGAEHFVFYDFRTISGVDENVFAYSNRCGNDRALVFYHNRHAVTAGWIRESTPFAVSGGGEAPALRCTTLADSLEVSPDPGVFHVFRDISTGFEFLRGGAEICEKGIYAELGEYEFHVFVDFRAIHDIDGSWGKLCEALNGRGVASLEEERLQVSFSALNEAFREALELAPPVCGDPEAIRGLGAELDDACQRFHTILREHSDGRRVGEVIECSDMSATLLSLSELVALKPRSARIGGLLDALSLRMTSVSGIRVLMSWLLLREHGVDSLESFGLDCSLRRTMNAVKPLGIDDPALLVHALLEFDYDERAQPSGREFENLFSISCCARYMLTHESGGVTWFNKERFEELITWLYIIRLYKTAMRRPVIRTLTSQLAACERELNLLKEYAEHAGYRVALFQNLLPLSASKKPVRRKIPETKVAPPHVGEESEEP